MRRLPLLALIAALSVPAGAMAQSTAQQMLDTARQIRADVEKLKDSLPADARAAMLKQADDIERSAASGDYAGVGAAPKPPTNAERILAERGRLDWLFAEAACTGYTQDNYQTFRYSPSINERDSHCRNAHGHWATYVRYARDPAAAEGAEQAPFYYDAATRRAVDHYGRR